MNTIEFKRAVVALLSQWRNELNQGCNLSSREATAQAASEAADAIQRFTSDRYATDKKFVSGKFEISVDLVAQHGYFEHEELGDGCGGELWFNDSDLSDYDGVPALPKAVWQGLEANGFTVGDDFK